MKKILAVLLISVASISLFACASISELTELFAPETYVEEVEPVPAPAPEPEPTAPEQPALGTAETSLNVLAPLFDGDRARMQNYASMGGETHRNVIEYHSFMHSETTFSLHNLHAQFSTLTGYFGRVDGTQFSDAIVRFYGDGLLLGTYSLYAAELPTPVLVPVNGVRLLRIEVYLHPMVSYAFAGHLE